MMKEYNDQQAEDIHEVSKLLEVGVISVEEARAKVKEIHERRPIDPCGIEFNINWYAEVILNESGAAIWNNSIYAGIHGHREAGNAVREQLHVLIALFGLAMFPWETPFRPQIRLFPEREVRLEVK